jgi:hypothetical protein
MRPMWYAGMHVVGDEGSWLAWSCVRLRFPCRVGACGPTVSVSGKSYPSVVSAQAFHGVLPVGFTAGKGAKSWASAKSARAGRNGCVVGLAGV